MGAQIGWQTRMTLHSVSSPSVKANNNTSGLKADEKAIVAQDVPIIAVSTGSAIRDGETDAEDITAPYLVPEDEIDHAIQKINCKAIKIGK